MLGGFLLEGVDVFWKEKKKEKAIRLVTEATKNILRSSERDKVFVGAEVVGQDPYLYGFLLSFISISITLFFTNTYE